MSPTGSRPDAVRLLAVLAGIVVALAVVPSVMSAADKRAVRLPVTPRLKQMLRASFLLQHHRYSPRRVKGPLKGSIYYGRYGRTRYAFATFSVPRTGTTDQPELFKRPPNGVFRDLGDTGGEICKRDVPAALIRVWRLKPSSQGCYAAP
jgi:hypothetical protein